MSGYKPRTIRMAAALREMAGLGVHLSLAATMLDTYPATILRIANSFGIELPRGRSGVTPWLRDRILRDYGKEGLTSAVMAERYGTTRNSVKVTISGLRKMGKLPQREIKCTQTN